MLSGALIFTRYAFPPNLKHYCGSDKVSELFYYLSRQKSDPGLMDLLAAFTVPPVYMEAIAKDNNIKDILDPRVVEAYWIGNDLLYRVKSKTLHEALSRRFGKQLTATQKKWLWRKLPAGAAATHSFHVFDVHSKVGFLPGTIKTMCKCRISWGQITAFTKDPQSKENALEISYEPLVLNEGKLALGHPMKKTIKSSHQRIPLLTSLKVGDWVSMHWDYVCDKLTNQQVANLRKFTHFHITLANQTI